MRLGLGWGGVGWGWVLRSRTRFRPCNCVKKFDMASKCIGVQPPPQPALWWKAKDVGKGCGGIQMVWDKDGVGWNGNTGWECLGWNGMDGWEERDGRGWVGLDQTGSDGTARLGRLDLRAGAPARWTLNKQREDRLVN